MKSIRYCITLFLLLAAAAAAQPKLHMKVFTSAPEGFSVNSTLVYGEKDAILIDGQFLLSEAHRLAAVILESKKNLTTVYITHWHPDHFFGLNVIKEAFPNARIVALPSVVEDIKKGWESKVKQWKPAYGENLTSTPVIPEPLQSTTLTLEGETLELVGGVQGDDKNDSYVWIPSLKAVVCGDVVFNGIYPWTLETTPALRKEWIATLDKIASLNPVVVIAGHQKVGMKEDTSSIQFTKNYLMYYDEALSSSKSSEEFQSKIKSKFPGLGLDIILKLPADAAFAKK